MNEKEKAILSIAIMMAKTLCFVIIAMTVALLGGLFAPNSEVDNNDIFPIIAPAFSTIIGGFIGWLAAIKMNSALKTDDEPQPTGAE
jgi:ABC-type branched-subunit amino acid transport system permease subunit